MSLTAILNGETQSAPRDNTQLLDHCDHHAAQSIIDTPEAPDGGGAAEGHSCLKTKVNTIESAIRHITCLEGCLRETSCKIEELEEAEFKEAIVP